jgi:YqjK-like protein
MTSRQPDLALQRERLLARSTVLRERVLEQSAALTPVLNLGDRLRDGRRWVGQHPTLVLSAVVLVVVVRPRTAWRWGLRAWSTWVTVHSWRHRLQALTGY